MQLFFPKLIDKNLSDMTTVLIKMCKESKWALLTKYERNET